MPPVRVLDLRLTVRISGGDDRGFCLRGAVDRADGTARRLPGQLARRVARGQSRDHPRRHRGLKTPRLSAHLLPRRPGGSRVMPPRFQTPRTVLTWATLEEWFDCARKIESRRA